MFCEGGIGTEEDMRNAKAAGARVLCRYNFPYAGTGINGPGTHAELPYTHLVEQSDALAKSWHELTEGDFWPTVMPGWDRRPWTKYEDVIYAGGTPELFRRTLESARSYVNKDRVVLIEAWNEWGEGSVLEPSVEHGFAYLDQVRGVFCPNAGPHKDAGPRSLGLRQPVFDVKLPSENTWRFDYDLNGWSGTGFADLRAHWGALHATSTSRDPQLTSSITYLDCAKYSRAWVRMRAEPGDEGPASATGQLFWSTIERELNEDASVKFEVLLDGKWHDYELDLAANSNWKGRTDRLRLDPVDVAGVDLRIDEIGLEEKP